MFIFIILSNIYLIFFLSFFKIPNTVQKYNEKENCQSNERPPTISSYSPLWVYDTGDDVYSVAISPDGNYVVAGSFNGLYVFNSSSSKLIWKNETIGAILEVAISADGNYIVAGTGAVEKKICFFHISDPNPLWTFTVNGGIGSIAISNDGSYIVVGSWDYNIYFFNKASANPLWTYKTTNQIYSVAISADGNYIAAQSFRSVYLFNNSGSPAKTPIWVNNTGNNVMAVAISADGNYIAAGCGLYVYLFNRSSPMPIWRKLISGAINSIDISFDGEFIVAGCANSHVYLFNKSNPNPIWNWPTLGAVWSVKISLDKNYIVAGDHHAGLGSEGTLYTFITDPLVQSWNYTMDGWITSVAISANGNYIVAGSLDDNMYLFPGLILYSDAFNPDKDGEFKLIWRASANIDNFTIYYYNKYITKINDSISEFVNGIKENSYNVSGLSNGTYYFKILAYSENGILSSNCIKVNIELGKPEPFACGIITEYPETYEEFIIWWDKNHEADNYSIYYSNRYITDINESVLELENGIKKNSYNVSGLSNGDYYFIIVAYNVFGNRNSNCIYVKVNGKPPAPFFIWGWSGSYPNPGDEVYIFWSSIERADYYAIYTHESYFSKINNSISKVVTTENSYTFTGLSNGTHYFMIVAYNRFGNSSSSCFLINVLVIIPSKFILESNAGNPDTDGAFRLSWTPSEEAENYSIYVHDSYITEINSSVTLLKKGHTSTRYNIWGLNNGTYYYKIVAHNKYGNRSSNCISVSVQLLPQPPGPFILYNISILNPDGSFNLNWSNSILAINYSIYIEDVNGDGFNRSIAGITNLTYLIVGLPEGSYYIIITAFNEFGNTTSNTIEVHVYYNNNISNLSDEDDENNRIESKTTNFILILLVLFIIFIGMTGALVSSSIYYYQAKKKAMIIERSKKKKNNRSLNYNSSKEILEEIIEASTFFQSLGNKKLVKDMGSNSMENIQLIRISEDFLKKVDKTEFRGDEKKEFIKEMLALSDKVRNEIVDNILNRLKQQGINEKVSIGSF